MLEVIKVYVNRIYEVSRRDFSLFIVYYYIRYFGDLFGGQIFRRMVIKVMDLLSMGEGVKFYEFENIFDVKKFKNMYRFRFDEFFIDKVKLDEIVKEVNYVFFLNIYLF